MPQSSPPPSDAHPHDSHLSTQPHGPLDLHHSVAQLSQDPPLASHQSSLSQDLPHSTGRISGFLSNLPSRSFSLCLHRLLMNLPLLRNSLHSPPSILLKKHFCPLPQHLSLFRINLLQRFLLFLLTHLGVLRSLPLSRFLRFLMPPLNCLTGFWLVSLSPMLNWLLLLLPWHLLFLLWLFLLPLLLMHLQPHLPCLTRRLLSHRTFFNLRFP